MREAGLSESEADSEAGEAGTSASAVELPVFDHLGKPVPAQWRLLNTLMSGCWRIQFPLIPSKVSFPIAAFTSLQHRNSQGI